MAATACSNSCGAAGGLGQRGASCRRQGEGRVGGEDGGEAGRLQQGAVTGERHRAVIRVRPHQPRGQRREIRHAVRDGIAQPDIGGQPLRPVGGGGIGQPLHHIRQPIEVEGAIIDSPADRQRDQQDRVAERVLRGGGPRFPQAGEEFLEGIGCDIGHGPMLHLRRRRLPGIKPVGVRRSAGLRLAGNREPHPERDQDGTDGRIDPGPGPPVAGLDGGDGRRKPSRSASRPRAPPAG
jgi:hypothetical protein